MQTLTTVTEQFKTNYKAKSFSNSSKEAMIDLVLKLKGSAFKDNFRKIINSLENIHEEGLKEKKGVWVFAKKNYEKKFGGFIKMVDELLISSLGKGFVPSNVKIFQEQSISLRLIKEFFNYISISILKK